MIHHKFLAAALILIHRHSAFAAPTINGNITSVISTSPPASSIISSSVSSASSVISPAASSHSSLPSQSPPDTSTAAESTPTAGYASDDPNDSFYDEFQDEVPEAIRGTLGATVIGPQNIPLDRCDLHLRKRPLILIILESDNLPTF